MSESVYLTKTRAQQAIDLALPSIHKIFDTVANNKHVHLVILTTDGSILLEADVGPDAGKDPARIARTTEVARSKAQIHFRTGRPAAEIQARRPNTLFVGDTIWGGSADHEGIIVAASGIQGYYDESIAGIIAAIFWGLCIDAQTAYMSKPDKSPIYKSPV